MTNESIVSEVRAAVELLAPSEREALLKELNAKYAPVKTKGSRAPADCPFKIGDTVTVKADAASVAKKWRGKTLKVTLIGTDRLYLDNPEFPGEKYKSVWPLFSDVTHA
jgi:hypothetical protein